MMRPAAAKYFADIAVLLHDNFLPRLFSCKSQWQPLLSLVFAPLATHILLTGGTFTCFRVPGMQLGPSASSKHQQGADSGTEYQADTHKAAQDGLVDSPMCPAAAHEQQQTARQQTTLTLQEGKLEIVESVAELVCIYQSVQQAVLSWTDSTTLFGISGVHLQPASGTVAGPTATEVHLLWPTVHSSMAIDCGELCILLTQVPEAEAYKLVFVVPQCHLDTFTVKVMEEQGSGSSNFKWKELKHFAEGRARLGKVQVYVLPIDDQLAEATTDLYRR